MKYCQKCKKSIKGKGITGMCCSCLIKERMEKGILNPATYGFQGGKHTEIAKQKIRQSKIAEKNPMWKGNNVGYASLHEWINKKIPKPEKCQNCGKEPPRDLANISQKYSRNLSDWEWLCRHCHMIKDGRINNLKQFQKGEKGK